MLRAEFKGSIFSTHIFPDVVHVSRCSDIPGNIGKQDDDTKTARRPFER